MTVVRRKLVLVLAVLLTAAAAAADTVITAEEVISCSVESASADSVRFALNRKRFSTLPAWDVYEVRLSNPDRLAEVGSLLWRSKVLLNSGQSILSPRIRTLEAMRLRLERARETGAQGVRWYSVVVETLAANASPARMAARCLEINAVLRHCGRGDDTVAGLTSEVDHEAAELRGLGSGKATCVSAMWGGLLGGAGGSIIGWNAGPPVGDEPGTMAGCLQEGFNAYAASIRGLIGCGVGLAAGSLVGLAVSHGLRESRLASHRARVNELIHRVNRAMMPAGRETP
jgi:hypothetical protein